MVSRQITKYRYNLLREEQEEIEKELEVKLELQKAARELGDLSENEEYSVTTAEVAQLRSRLREIGEILQDVEVIETIDNGPRFTLGSRIQFTQVDKEGNVLKAPRKAILDEHGDTVTDQILGTGSLLGKAILNGTDGVYRIQTDLGELFYKVIKIREE